MRLLIKIQILTLLALISLSGKAQWVVSPAGNRTTGTSGTFDYTMGQLAVQSISISGGTMREGVQQPYIHSISDTIYDDICQGQPYNENGFDIAIEDIPDTGIYYFNRITNDGTAFVLVLTVKPTSIFIEELADCDSLVWHGNTYYENTTTANWHTTNIFGCDSIVHLHLTLGHTTTGPMTEDQAAYSYLWYGNTYTTSGTYSHVLTNTSGCDSLIQLKLSLIEDKPLPHIYAYTDKAILLDHFPLGPNQPRIDYDSYRWYKEGEEDDNVRGDVYFHYQDDQYQVLSGCYYVEVPTDSTNEYWVKSNTVCIQSAKKESKDLIIGIYPNPTNAGSEVQFNLSEECIDGDLQLYDEVGRMLLSHTITSTHFAIPMVHGAGAYTVFIKTVHGNVSIQKIIVR